MVKFSSLMPQASVYKLKQCIMYGELFEGNSDGNMLYVCSVLCLLCVDTELATSVCRWYWQFSIHAKNSEAQWTWGGLTHYCLGYW